MRIILSSSQKGDLIFDPFAGAGTTLNVAKQLGRQSIGLEIDPENVARIQERITTLQDSDRVEKLYYCHTENIEKVWRKAENKTRIQRTNRETNDSIGISPV